MTDSEIIKSFGKDIDLIDLINRQQAEIERLKEESSDKERAYTDEYCLRKEWQDKCRQLLIEKQTAKSEAIKEFATRLEEYSYESMGNYGISHMVVSVKDIDNLIKEMEKKYEIS